MSLTLHHTPSAPLPQQYRAGAEPPATPPPPPPAPTLGPTGDERPFFRLDMVRALQLHRNLALGIMLAGALLALALAVKMWPIYTAKSQIYIQPIPPRVLEQGNEPRWPYDANTYDSFIQQQVQSASNPEVLADALHKLPAGSFQHAGESDVSAAHRLGETIEVARIGTSYEVMITARTSDPGQAADVANAVANSIVERASGEANAGDSQRLTILREERDRVQKELDSDRSEQDGLNKQLGMAAVGVTAPDLIDDAIDKTREELIKARTDHDEAEARFSSMGAGQGTSTAIEAQADELISSDPGLTSMKTSLNQRRAVLITQMSNLTPSNPEYKQDAEELQQINANLDAMMNDLRAKAADRIQQQLRADLERTAGVEGQLNGQLRQLAGTAASATPKLQRASDLASDIVRLQTRYAAVDEQIHNLMLQDSVPGAVHVSVPASAPTHPSYSGILKKTLPIGLAGLIFGLLAALIANNLDPKIYIASDVEQVLGVTPMAVLPNFTEVSDDAAAEHVLRIAASIEHACKQGSLRRVIFTGANLGAGATTIVTRVKEMLEAMGRDTILIDAASAHAQAARANGAAGEQSLALSERGSRSSALLQQVAQDEVPHAEDKLVLTDTAPLTISAETAYLARFVDCVIVVVQSGETTRVQLREVAQTLQRLNAAAAGFVLNRVSLATADPAFRQSVAEVEKHLSSQNRASGRRAAQTPAPKPEVRNYPETKAAAYPAPAGAVYAPPAAAAYAPAAVAAYAPPAQKQPPIYTAPKHEPAPVRGPESIRSWEPVSIAPEPFVASAPALPLVAAPAPRTEVPPPRSIAPVPTYREDVPAPPRSIAPVSAPASTWREDVPAPPRSIAPVAPRAAVPPPADPPRFVETPKAAADAETLWWLADANPAPAPAAQPARPGARLETWGRAPETPASFDPVSSAPAAPIAEPPAEPPAQSWERLAARGNGITGADARDDAEDENPHTTTASRLSGLRGMFLPRGQKSPKNARQEEAPVERPMPQSAPKPEYTDYPRVPAAPAGPVSVSAAAAAVRNAAPVGGVQVIAEPEFLPPKSVVVMIDKDREQLDDNSVRRDRREAYDDLQILPSWRGQYRKRD